ncbi:MAG: lamin tail domain-containing protein [Bacteroidota bacterium]
MKALKLLLLVFFFGANVQAQINDDFSDGDHTSNPPWEGDVSDFIVNSSNQLQLNATGEGESYLVTANQLADSVQWEFLVRYGFAPSGNNFGRVYLISDQQNIETGTVQGYYLQFGETGSNDAIELFRQDGSSITSVCRGMDGFIASSFEIRVRVIRDQNGNWDILADPNGGYNFQLQASGQDNTYQSTAYFGFYCDYTMSYADDFYFDDVQVKTYVPDTIPPDVEQISVINAQELMLAFSEPVQLSSMEDPMNYTVNKGIGNPASAVQDVANPKQVILNFASSFTSTVDYQISVQGVKDLAGNMLSTTDTFTFYQPEQGDVVINEIMADPTPQVGLPDAEYLELYNQADYPVSLNDWKLIIGTSANIISGLTIQPDSFLLICDDDDTAAFTAYGDVFALSSMALTNSGTSITLKNEQEQVIHHVAYKDSWYQDDQKDDGGWSLEQIDPLNFCGGASNWQASTALLGGTPGAENAVDASNPDLTAPSVSNVRVLDSVTLEVIFSEPMDSLYLNNAAFVLDQGVGQAQIQQIKAPKYQNVILDLNQKIVPSVLYQLQLQDTVKDCAGNASFGLSFEFALVEPDYQDVVFSEVMCKPADDKSLPEVEYVELYNRTAFPLDVGGWKFSYSGNTPKQLPSQVILPDSFLIICDDDDADLLTGYGPVLPISSLLLPNSGSQLLLTDSLNQVIAFLDYHESWYKNDFKQENGGWSLEMIDPNYPCIGYDNWQASKSASGGTPGRTNSVNASNPDGYGPRFVSTQYVNPSIFILEFDESLDPERFPVAGDFLLQGAGAVLDVQLLKPGFSTIQIVLPLSLKQDSLYLLQLKDTLFDCAGNPVQDFVFPLAFPSVAEKNDLLINEVLFNASADTDDFMEVINNSGKPLVLYNLNVVYANADNGAILDEVSLNKFNRILFDGEIRCFTREKRSLIDYYQRSEETNIFTVEDLPALQASQGMLLLRNSADGHVVDSMRYVESMHNALIKDPKGISLERINPDLPSMQAGNWTSAAETAGYATPGVMNSQYLKTGQRQQGKIDLEYKMFSPNGDGNRDVLVINYQFGKAGYNANVRIYDRNGIQIRELHNNVLLESEGSFIWDGSMDDASKAPVGIYLIYVEVFDTDGNIGKYKKAAVVGGRLN